LDLEGGFEDNFVVPGMVRIRKRPMSSRQKMNSK
jgi:hypothetical protein